MPHSNSCTTGYLSLVLATHRWTELILAKRTGISQSIISRHLSGERRIERHHLAAYINALDPTERNGFLAAWLQDLGLDGRELVNKPRKRRRKRLGGLLLAPWLDLIGWLERL